MELRVKHPYSWVGHIPFAVYLVQNLKPKVIVELGTHTGNSFCSFLFAAKNYSPKTKVYAVDLWTGDYQAGFYDESVYLELKEYLDSNFSEFGKLIRKDFNEAVNEFVDNSIDILHIDGLHTYEAVKNDFFKWKPKLTKNSIVLFHDTSVVKEEFGVKKFWDELKSEYQNHFEFYHSNGLGVISVSDERDHFVNTLKNDQFLVDQFITFGNCLLDNQLLKVEIDILKPKVSILEKSRYFKLRSDVLKFFK